MRFALDKNEFAPTHPAPVWVGRFGAHLMARLPSMKFVNAVRCAVVTWPYAHHLQPEAAADILRARLLRNAPIP
jgi:hypothetical protein